MLTDSKDESTQTQGRSSSELCDYLSGSKTLSVPVYVVPGPLDEDSNIDMVASGKHQIANLTVIQNDSKLVDLKSFNNMDNIGSIRIIGLGPDSNEVAEDTSRMSKSHGINLFTVSRLVNDVASISSPDETRLLVSSAGSYDQFLQNFNSSLCLDAVIQPCDDPEGTPITTYIPGGESSLTSTSPLMSARDEQENPQNSSSKDTSLKSMLPIFHVCNLSNGYVSLELEHDTILHSLVSTGTSAKKPRATNNTVASLRPIETTTLAPTEDRPIADVNHDKQNRWDSGRSELRDEQIWPPTQHSPLFGINHNLSLPPQLPSASVKPTQSVTSTPRTEPLSVSHQDLLDQRLDWDSLSIHSQEEEYTLNETPGISTLWIGNLPEGAKEDDLRNFFRNHPVLRIAMSKPKPDKRPCAYAEVRSEDMDRVLKLSGERLFGQRLKVEYDPNRLQKIRRKKPDTSIQADSSSYTMRNNTQISGEDPYERAYAIEEAANNTRRSQLLKKCNSTSTLNAFNPSGQATFGTGPAKKAYILKIDEYPEIMLYIEYRRSCRMVPKQQYQP
ncbi:hypothetical protein HDV05_002573 [Chytridiales sp. JEL 0842]|nr:hypothetical protein HDV05_002573 [Chytridiales sp. JEL 0842]